mmetsp:Transcript_64423/g.179161  ORF Transcript_64423/g.179161 Transcript_64423/m.179161 type:complete len:279 (+) Transcript_64423:1813-2649(+)
MECAARSWSNMRSMWPLALTKLPSARPAVPSTPFHRRASKRILIKSFACGCICHVSVKLEKNMASAKNATMLPRCTMSVLSFQLRSNAVKSFLMPSARPKLSNMTVSVLRNWSVAPVKMCFKNVTICSVSVRSAMPSDTKRHWNMLRTSECTRINLRTNLISAIADIAFHAVGSVDPASSMAVNNWPTVTLTASAFPSSNCSNSRSSSRTSRNAARKAGETPTSASRFSVCVVASTCNWLTDSLHPWWCSCRPQEINRASLNASAGAIPWRCCVARRV